MENNVSKFGDDNIDVLQNIEFGIVEAYRADKALLDYDVKDALDALVRHYHAEQEQRTPPALRLGERARHVFDAVQSICEWRLGRAPGPGRATDHMEPFVAIDDVVGCLRQIQKSVPRWSERGGRQGYLKFVSQYVG